MELILDEKPLDWSTTEIFTVIYEGEPYKCEAYIQDSGEDIPDISIEVLQHGLDKEYKDKMESEILEQFEKNYKITRKLDE